MKVVNGFYTNSPCSYKFWIVLVSQSTKFSIYSFSLIFVNRADWHCTLISTVCACMASLFGREFLLVELIKMSYLILTEHA